MRIFYEDCYIYINWFETSMSYRIILILFYIDFYFSDICQEKHRIMILKTAHDDDDEDDFGNDDRPVESIGD